MKKWEKRLKGEQIRARVNAGEEVINREPGNSMVPILRSREPVVLKKPDRRIRRGDIVFAKVKGRFYTHLVLAVGSDGRYLIGNNHGGVNGWTRDIVALATPLKKRTPDVPEDSQVS